MFFSLYFEYTYPRFTGNSDQANPILKEKLYKKMEAYVARAEVIKEYLDSAKQSPPLTALVDNAGGELNGTHSHGTRREESESQSFSPRETKK